MNSIISVNYHIPAHDNSFISYQNKASLSDADIILFFPSTKPGDEVSHPHWKSELTHVLHMGKTVVVLLTAPFSKSYSFLPDSALQFIQMNGIEVHSKSKLTESLYNSLKSNWEAKCYMLGVRPENVLFSSKNNDRILGAFFKINKGNIILLPYLNINSLNIGTVNQWNDLGKDLGNRLVHGLSDIHDTLNFKEEATDKPQWTDSIEFEIEAVTQLSMNLENNLKTIENLAALNDELLKKIKDKEIIKNLLFETGKPLENAVTHSLKILGYAAENYDDGVLELDQVILSPEGDRFICECEGKDTKAIDITKFRQLQDALNEDFHREEINEKAFGILLGNPQRLINPSDRNLDFTEKCKNGAKRELIGLINTVDLFKVVRYLSGNNDEDFKRECRKAIKEHLGRVILFPDLPQ